MENKIDRCHAVVDKRTGEKCGLPLPECIEQSHWETRLRDYKLSPKRAMESRFVNDQGVEVNREYSTSIQDFDKTVVGPLVLPEDPRVREVMVSNSLGVLTPQEPRRFWPRSEGTPIQTAYIKTGRMGLVYGQEMPK